LLGRLSWRSVASMGANRPSGTLRNYPAMREEMLLERNQELAEIDAALAARRR
jgi:hypothetical protein